MIWGCMILDTGFAGVGSICISDTAIPVPAQFVQAPMPKYGVSSVESFSIKVLNLGS